MPCFKPLPALYTGALTKRGKRHNRIFSRKTFDYARYSSSSNFFQLPCGQCVGCRLERSRQWAMRLMHELPYHETACFITLTYDNANLPDDGSLNLRHFQLFMKRLRQHRIYEKADALRVNSIPVGGVKPTLSVRKARKLAAEYVKPLRYFHCGEYGDESFRPHYHAILFGVDFDDKYLWQERHGGNLYRSSELESLWTMGFSSIGSVTFESCAYVARYILKKVTGEAAIGWYADFDEGTGELIDMVKSEYVTMSRRPGIGKAYFDQYAKDKLSKGLDEIIMRGRKMSMPKYYDGLYELFDPDGMCAIKAKRVARALLHQADCTPERLEEREECKLVQIKSLTRSLPDDIVL